MNGVYECIMCKTLQHIFILVFCFSLLLNDMKVPTGSRKVDLNATI